MGAENCVDQVGERHLTFLDPNHCHSRKQGHNALRVVEDARGFEDQHEAERDQRIHHPGHQPVQSHFHREE